MGTFDFREYYRQNKKRIRDRRKMKYDTDPEYRKSILEKSREAYLRRRAAKQAVDRRVHQDETGEVLFSVGIFAKAARRSILTIRAYHRTGFLPAPTHCDSRGWRLYTEKQVQLAKKVFQALDWEKIDRKKAIALFHKGWGNG